MRNRANGKAATCAPRRRASIGHSHAKATCASQPMKASRSKEGSDDHRYEAPAQLAMATGVSHPLPVDPVAASTTTWPVIIFAKAVGG